MFPCHACSRHVLDDARACPFCGAALRSAPAPAQGVLLTAVLGLALVGCGDPDPGDEGASTANTSVADSTGGTTADPSATSMGTSAGQETASPGDTFEAEAADYGGPTGEPPPDTSTSDTGGTATDTGATTGDPGMETEGADYAGPASTG